MHETMEARMNVLYHEKKAQDPNTTNAAGHTALAMMWRLKLMGLQSAPKELVVRIEAERQKKAEIEALEREVELDGPDMELLEQCQMEAIAEAHPESPRNFIPREVIAREVVLERARQIAKGFDAEHDAEHGVQELVNAAICFATPDVGAVVEWPFEEEYFEQIQKVHLRDRLIQSAALIMAAVEQIDAEATGGEDLEGSAEN